MSDFPRHRPGLSPEGRFGEPPTLMGHYDFSADWHEFLHYLYLPVRLPAHEAALSKNGIEDTGLALPERLAFLTDMVYDAWNDARLVAPHLDDPYVYVTARRGFASPGNPLNRPGWHTDDFGGTDLNYIWTDAFPTRFLLADAPLPISDGDTESMKDMAVWARRANDGLGWTVDDSEARDMNLRIVDGPTSELLRLTPQVIHDTPLIPEPGGMRSFVKISISTHRYNLLGNSHNHLLDYDWPMYDRAAVRNQPQGGNNDYVKEVSEATDTAVGPRPCRSVGPDGTRCAKPAGHRRPAHRGAKGRSWFDGVNVPARWVPRDEVPWDSEAAHLIQGKYGI